MRETSAARDLAWHSRRAILSLAALAVVAVGWGPDPAEAQQKPIAVVTTIAQLGDAARAVGGARVAVDTIMGEGVDPHLYKPTRSDIQKLARADLVIANGHHLEAQFETVLAEIGRRRPVLFAAETLPPEKLLPFQGYPDRRDPHVWMDPELWSGLVLAVRDTLTEIDPAGRAAFEAGAAAYLAELGDLSAYAKRAMASVPAQARILVTAHDAFGYFGRAYGFEVVGIQGVSTESEAGLKRIEELVALLVAKQIKAVFVESSVPDQNMRAILEGAAARGHATVIGAELFSDALGAPGTYTGTLLGMLDHNLTSIARALGGEAPEAGWRGKLAKRGS